ncbi:MAG: RrF2 family transcriptional regulator [Candidatus Zixiibacteriota bacterium]
MERGSIGAINSGLSVQRFSHWDWKGATLNLSLSKSAGYAIHALAYIAGRGGKEPIMAREIAREYDLPYDSVLKILRTLAKVGHLKPYRGCQGGFALAISAEQITLLEVVEAIDGPVMRSESKLDGFGDQVTGRRAHLFLRSAAEKLQQSLAKNTIADLVRNREEAHSEKQGGSKAPGDG